MNFLSVVAVALLLYECKTDTAVDSHIASKVEPSQGEISRFFQRRAKQAHTREECKEFLRLGNIAATTDLCAAKASITDLSADSEDRIEDARSAFIKAAMETADSHGACTYLARFSGQVHAIDPCGSLPAVASETDFAMRLIKNARTLRECEIYVRKSGLVFAVTPCGQ